MSHTATQTPASPKSGQQSGPVPSGPSVPLPPAPTAASGPALCGQPHEYRTKTGEKKTKPCVKARGHEGLHSSRAVSQKVDMSVLSGINLEEVAEEVPTTELLDTVTDRIRSAEQLKVDAAVAAGHEKWTKAGKPAGFNDAIKKGAATRYMLQPEHVAAVRTLLRRAENAPDLRGKVHVRIAPPKTHVSGAKMLYFVVVDRKPATPKAAVPTAAAASGVSPTSSASVGPTAPAAPTGGKK